ncbi:hypothetical protein DMB37_11425 [Nocardia sp. CS682]|nr:hypothetical protein DMB37_11425 [Nocardia sp. CS682]
MLVEARNLGQLRHIRDLRQLGQLRHIRDLRQLRRAALRAALSTTLCPTLRGLDAALCAAFGATLRATLGSLGAALCATLRPALCAALRGLDATLCTALSAALCSPRRRGRGGLVGAGTGDAGEEQGCGRSCGGRGCDDPIHVCSPFSC